MQFSCQDRSWPTVEFHILADGPKPGETRRGRFWRRKPPLFRRNQGTHVPRSPVVKQRKDKTLAPVFGSVRQPLCQIQNKPYELRC
jgi:hypothetical protein